MPQRKTKSPARYPNHLLLPLAALGLLVLVNLLTTHNFATIEIKDGRVFGAAIDIVHRSVPVMLLAIGMTLVIATRGIDLSVGSVMAITGAACAVLLTKTSMDVPLIVAIGLLSAGAAGAWNGILVAYLGIQPIVATLILMVAGRGLAQLLTEGQIRTFSRPAFEFAGNGSLFGLPFTWFIAAAVLIVAGFLARRTVIGTYVEAVGGNETAARYSGIRTDLVKLFVYAFSGLCAGAAGIITAADIRAADPSNAGLDLELDAILAVVIGGTLFTGGRFSLVGSVIGALVIQTLTTTILMKGVDVQYTLVVKAVVVVVVCLIQSPSTAAFFGRWSMRRRSKA